MRAKFTEFRSTINSRENTPKFHNETSLLVLHKLSWNVSRVFRTGEISGYGYFGMLTYCIQLFTKYQIEREIRSYCCCQSLPEGLRMPTETSLSLTVYHNRGAKDVDFNIYGTSFRSLESSGDKPLHMLTIFFLGSINHYPRGNEQRTMTSYVLV